jgi:anti-sigma regulatory factor (Ser/Thr protein kinase)
MGALMGLASGESNGQVGPLRLRVPARPESLGPIRRALGGIGLPERVLKDATLLTTELVTNSIRHANLGPRDTVDVTAVWSGAVLRVIVRDSGSARLPRDIVAGSIRPSPGAQSGWGLYLVDRLATRWGTNLGGSVGFWFELEEPLRGGPSA